MAKHPEPLSTKPPNAATPPSIPTSSTRSRVETDQAQNIAKKFIADHADPDGTQTEHDRMRAAHTSPASVRL